MTITNPQTSPSRGGLIGWGVLLIVVGAMLSVFLLGSAVAYLGIIEQDLLTASTPSVRRQATPKAPPVDATAVVGAIALVAAAGGFLWTGIASCLGRRWVRPIVMIGSVSLMVVGLIAVVTTLLSIPHLMDRVNERFWEPRGGTSPIPGAVLSVILIRLSLSAIFMILVPWLMYLFYASGRTREALDVLDPRVLWTDRMPVAALGWTLFVGVIGIFLLASARMPILPTFGTLLTGAGAIIAACVLGGGLVWAATLCFRGERAGWATAFVLLVVTRGITAVYYWIGGAPVSPGAKTAEDVQNLWARHGALVPEWLPAIMATFDTLLVIIFGLYVGRYFVRRDGARVLESKPTATGAP
jgi:hypothetical protein